VVFTLAFAQTALGAAGPSPEKATAYDNFHTSAGFVTVNPDVLLVTGPGGTEEINKWVPGTGDNTALDAGSYVELTCPGAPKKNGFKSASAGVTFPGARFALSGGKYEFSRSWTSTPYKNYWFSSAQPPTLHLRLTGTVVSPTAISGTLTVSGGGCSTTKPLHYQANADKAYSVTPGT